MTELSFTQTAHWWESAPIIVNGDFALHIEFSDVLENEIQVLRSASGDNHVVAWRTSYAEPSFDRSFVGAVEGLSIIIRSKSEPTSAIVIP